MLEMDKDGVAFEESTKPSAFRRFRRCLRASSSVPLKLSTASSRLLVHTPTPPPATFPTPAEIREHGELVQSSTVEDRRVWRIEWQGVNMYVKEGKDVDASEVQLTELAREKTGLPIPKIYHCAQDGGLTFISLEALIGEDLVTALWGLSSRQQRRLFKEVKDALQRLHGVKAPPGALVGGLNARPLSALLFERDIAPSLHSSAELHSYLRQLFISHNPSRAAEYDRDIAPHLGAPSPLVLVHGDLHPGNILVHNGRLSGILDFGRAGWYPEWVEGWYAALYMCTRGTVAHWGLLQQITRGVTRKGRQWRWSMKADAGWMGAIDS